MNSREALAYFFYFTLCLFLLTSQWFWNLSPRRYFDPGLEPLYDFYELSIDLLGRSTQYFQSRSRLLGTVKALRKQNRRLKRRVYLGEAVRRENKQLRRYLDLPETDGFTIKPAEILRRNLLGWERTLRINRGRKEGFRTDQLALQPRGDTWIIRGKIDSITSGHAMVMLSSDPRFKIGVRLEGIPNRQFVARGWGRRGLRIDHFPPFLPLETGSRVFSAPASTIAPVILTLGRVTGVQKKRRRTIGRQVRITPPPLSDRKLIWVVMNHD